MSVLEGGSEGQGKSKQLFFFSYDKKYVIKTVKRHELQLMKDLIGDASIIMLRIPIRCCVDSMACTSTSLSLFLYMTHQFPHHK